MCDIRFVGGKGPQWFQSGEADDIFVAHGANRGTRSMKIRAVENDGIRYGFSRQSRRHICSPQCKLWEQSQTNVRAVENGDIINREVSAILCRRFQRLASCVVLFPHLAMWATNIPPSSTVFIERGLILRGFLGHLARWLLGYECSGATGEFMSGGVEERICRN